MCISLLVPSLDDGIPVVAVARKRGDTRTDDVGGDVIFVAVEESTIASALVLSSGTGDACRDCATAPARDEVAECEMTGIAKGRG